MLKRNIIIIFISAVVLISCNSSSNNEIDKEKLKTELSDHANEFMMGLKSVLVSNMKKGGPLNAVNVCSDTASQLAKLYSDAMGISVKRFSLKNRNLNNTPNDFELKALTIFENLKKSGELDKITHVFEVTENNIAKFVKPILVDAPCLTCHGDNSQISDEVVEVLNKKYPEDKAIGYKIGDLRGAISVTKQL